MAASQVLAMSLDAQLGSEPIAAIGGLSVETSNQSAGPRLVYLLSCYPAVSHTFFLNEIRELRKLGLLIEVASINDPDRERSFMPAVEAEETEKTHYIKSQGMTQAAGIALKTLLVRPQVFFRGVSAALQLGRWNTGATVYALLYLAEALLLGDWMRLRGLRHLHIHFCGPVATVGMLASMAWGFPYSLTVHGPDEFYDVEKFYLHKKIAHAGFILCISEFCRSQLMRVSSPEHWDKMHIVRLGVDPSVFKPLKSESHADRELVVVCVGRLVPSKGQLILLQAAEQLVLHGHSIQVRLVGDGPDREHLEAFAANSAVRVRFEGNKSHDEIRHILAEADIFALASFAEGVPVALMEAMAMEVPCVSTCIAGIPELIRDGLEGLLVPASSTESLALALQRLIEDPALGRSLGVAGARRVMEKYNLSENTRTLAGVFKEHIRNN